MIKLSEVEKDALIEIGNIGMSRAGKQLSILLNSAVNITIPKINLLAAKEIPNEGFFDVDRNLAYVCQSLSNDLIGRAVLIFNREHTSMLTHAIIGDMPKLSEKEVRACEQEAMLEIGNIIITSCISAIVNMLDKKVKLSTPLYNEDTIKNLIDEQVNSLEEYAREVFMIATKLETTSRDISGKLVLILTDNSIVNLLHGIKELLKG